MPNDISGFLQKDTAGLPNWGWILVIGGGIAAAYLLPRFFGSQSNTGQTATDTGTGSSGLGLAIDPSTGLPYAVEGLVPSGAQAGNPIDITITSTSPTGTTTTTTQPQPGAANNPFIALFGTKLPAGFKNTLGAFWTDPNGQIWTVVPGPDNRSWGVKGKVTDVNKLKSMPIAPGQKQLLFGTYPGAGNVAPSVATNQSVYVPIGQWPYGISSIEEAARAYGITPGRALQLNPRVDVTQRLYPGQSIRVA
jgi:hypothetical protein